MRRAKRITVVVKGVGQVYFTDMAKFAGTLIFGTAEKPNAANQNG
jgi:hypothetical protein